MVHITYNFDESGLYFNLLLERALSVERENWNHEGVKSKQRLTAVFVCNSDGSENSRQYFKKKN